MEQRPIRLIIADDNRIFMYALKFYLESEGEFIVIGLVKNGNELINILDHKKCDIILIDNDVTEMNGISTIKDILKISPEIHIISLTKSCDEMNFYEMIKAGAKCCLSKNKDLDMLKNVIKTILEGRCYIEQENMVSLQNNVKGKSSNIILTEKEIEILQYLSDGLSNEEIASKLCQGEKTFDNLKRNLINKLGARNIANAIKIGIKNRLIKI